LKRVSVELVPRTAEGLQAELSLLKEHFSVVNAINIPDLLRYPIRSWEGCELALPHYEQVIPHIRAIDVDMNAPLPMAEAFKADGIREVLIVSGDPPQDMSRKMYPSTCVEIIRKFKQELPGVKVYAGIDQYRGSMRQELDYVKRKLYAGADGFFTQPFFDMRLMEIYAEQLRNTEVFWGIAPVLTAASATYWATKNNVIFPAHFQPTWDWNIAIARQAVELIRDMDSNVYFMPIRADIKTYLEQVF